MSAYALPFPASVFDLIPKDDIRKLEAIKEAAKMAASRFHSAGTTSSENNNDGPAPASIGPSVAEQSTSGEQGKAWGPPVGEKGEPARLFAGSFAMKPFHKDPGKQDRYDRYLALLQQGVKGEPVVLFGGGGGLGWAGTALCSAGIT